MWWGTVRGPSMCMAATIGRQVSRWVLHPLSIRVGFSLVCGSVSEHSTMPRRFSGIGLWNPCGYRTIGSNGSHFDAILATQAVGAESRRHRVTIFVGVNRHATLSLLKIPAWARNRQSKSDRYALTWYAIF